MVDEYTGIQYKDRENKGLFVLYRFKMQSPYVFGMYSRIQIKVVKWLMTICQSSRLASCL